MPADRPRLLRNPIVLLVLLAAAVTAVVYLLREGRPREARDERLGEVLHVLRAPAEGAPRPVSGAVPPVLFQLPRFRLVNETGASFGLRELQGKAWIASFFFTSCPSICPKLTRRMKKLEERTRPFGARVHHVSFSVDPKTDTPARLRAYGQKWGVDPRRWTLLTGPLPDVEHAIREGFKQAMEKQTTPVTGPLGEDLYDITHGARFVLVDAAGGLRGFYDSDPAGRDALMGDLSALLGGAAQRFDAGPTP